MRTNKYMNYNFEQSKRGIKTGKVRKETIR